MLLVVLLLIDDDIAVNQNVVEEKKLPGLGLLSAHFRQNAFAHQDSPWHAQLLPRASKAVFDEGDSPRIGFAVDCKGTIRF